MVDWNSADEAWEAFEDEARKLSELGKHWAEASTTIRTKGNSLEMTFNGRGEPIDLVFNGSKYRQLAPAQLAQIIIETLQKGRAQAQQKMVELMGTPDIPGLDVNGLITGEVGPDELLNALVGPMLEGFDDRAPKERRDG
jgi:YbaB/EbfC DNA-binding family